MGKLVSVIQLGIGRGILNVWLPALIRPAAIGMAVLMLGAMSMHLKVRDPLKKSLPAFTLLVLSVIVALARA